MLRQCAYVLGLFFTDNQHLLGGDVPHPQPAYGKHGHLAGRTEEETGTAESGRRAGASAQNSGDPPLYSDLVLCMNACCIHFE